MGRPKAVIPLLPLALLACERGQGDMAGGEAEEAVEVATGAVDRATVEFMSDAREVLTEVAAATDELDAQNAKAQEPPLTEWNESKREIAQARLVLETGMMELRTATEERASQLRKELTDGLEALTERVARARLIGARNSQEFITASKEVLTEIDQKIASMSTEVRQLPQEARTEASASIEKLRTEAGHLKERVADLAEIVPRELAAERESIAQAVASLSASVRRQWLEVRHDVTTG